MSAFLNGPTITGEQEEAQQSLPIEPRQQSEETVFFHCEVEEQVLQYLSGVKPISRRQMNTWIR